MGTLLSKLLVPFLLLRQGAKNQKAKNTEVLLEEELKANEIDEDIKRSTDVLLLNELRDKYTRKDR